MKTIKELREKKNLTQVALARMCMVQQATISDIERGVVKNPSVETAQRIAKVLGVSTESLFPIDETNVA